MGEMYEEILLAVRSPGFIVILQEESPFPKRKASEIMMEKSQSIFWVRCEDTLPPALPGGSSAGAGLDLLLLQSRADSSGEENYCPSSESFRRGVQAQKNGFC
ncbi:uncharacterized protein ACIQIH_012973 isoform 1-T5 [Cyanocitta cristata]